jgi:hypothetical protein
MTLRTQAEIRKALVQADLAVDQKRTQSGRLMAQAVADSLRWVLNEEKDFNVVGPIIQRQP